MTKEGVRSGTGELPSCASPGDDTPLTYTTRRFLLASFLSGCCAALGLAAPPGLGVRDGAGLSRAETVEKANGEIAELRYRFHQDLLVETFAGVPADQVKAFRALLPSERKSWVTRW